MRKLIGALCLIVVTILAVSIIPHATHAQENVRVAQGVSVYPIVERLTMHYIEHLVEKPKTNEELLRLYKIAFKNLEKTVMECDSDDYGFELLPKKK